MCRRRHPSATVATPHSRGGAPPTHTHPHTHTWQGKGAFFPAGLALFPALTTLELGSSGLQGARKRGRWLSVVCGAASTGLPSRQSAVLGWQHAPPVPVPAGPLPGINGSFQALTRLVAGGNMLSGTIPDAWAGAGIFAVSSRAAKQAMVSSGVKNLFGLEDNALTGGAGWRRGNGGGDACKCGTAFPLPSLPPLAPPQALCPLG